MAEDNLSFKEMCARFDVTPRTLRYYEYIELLSPIRDGRSRYYRPREVARMTLIMRGRRFGFSLEEIRQWLEMYNERGTDTQYAVWVEAATAKLDDLRQQQVELQSVIDDLADLRDKVARQVATPD